MKLQLIKDSELFDTSKAFSLTGNQPVIINKFIIQPPETTGTIRQQNHEKNI